MLCMKRTTLYRLRTEDGMFVADLVPVVGGLDWTWVYKAARATAMPRAEALAAAAQIDAHVAAHHAARGLPPAAKLRVVPTTGGEGVWR